MSWSLEQAADRRAQRERRRAFIAGFALVIFVIALGLSARSVPGGAHFFDIDGGWPTWIWRAAGAGVAVSLFAAGWFGTKSASRRAGLPARIFGIAIAMIAAGLLAGVLGIDPHSGIAPPLPHVASLALSIGGAVLAALTTLLFIVTESVGQRRARPE